LPFLSLSSQATVLLIFKTPFTFGINFGGEEFPLNLG